VLPDVSSDDAMVRARPHRNRELLKRRRLMSRMRGQLRLVVLLVSLVALMLTGLAQRRNSNDLLAPRPAMDERAAAAAGRRQTVPASPRPFDPLQRLQAPETLTLRPRTSIELATTASVAASASLDASTIFLEALTFGSGGNRPSSLAAADLNGDGRPDLLIANACDSSSNCTNGLVSVLLSNGDGTFQQAVSYASGGVSASSVAVGDVNGDGKPDLLVANACNSGSNCTNGVIGVLLGNGDGTFQTAVSYGSGGASANSTAVADVNGDGKPDVIVSNFYMGNGNYSKSTVGVLLGNGDGTFRAAVSYDPGGAYAVSVAVGDVNGDGKPDLVVASQCVSSTNCTNGTIGVLLGNGNGTFQSPVTYASGGTNASSVAVGDFNGDGKPDLTVSNQCATSSNCYNVNGTVGVLLNNGDGTFQAAIAYASGAFGSSSVAVGDVNHDGRPDLLVANQCPGSNSNSTSCTNGTVSIFFGNGDGSFRLPFTYGSGGYAADSIAVADVNGDGKSDLLVVNSCVGTASNCPTGGVGILLGNGDGTFQASPSYSPVGQIANSTAVGDLNGDGKSDLIIANQCASGSNCANGEVSVLLGNGNGTFQTAVSYGSGGYDAVSVAVGDVNGDGKPDLLVANQCASSTNCANGTIAVLLGIGDGTFRSALSYDSGGQYAAWVAVGDVNGDGKPDLVIASQCFSSANCVNGAISVLLGNGDGTFQTAQDYSSGGEFASSVALADVNGDGKPDLVAVNEYAGNGNLSNGTVAVLLGNANGTFQQAATYSSAGQYAFAVVIADVNGDGAPDLLITNQCATPGCTDGILSVLLGNGDGTFQSAITTTTPQVGIGALVLADFDGDGKLDVSSGPGDFLLIGNGDGTFQSPLILGGAGPGIAVGDFNRDGKPDLAIGGVVLLNISPRKIVTTTAMVSSVNPSNFNQSVTFTATVTPQGSGTPTGTVTFTDGATTLGVVALKNGTAALSSSMLVAGAHSITASYGGDASFRPSTSASLPQTVRQATTTTALTSSANPSYLNQIVTFAVTVTSQNGGALTGKVTFKQGTTTLGTVALANGQAAYSTAYTTTGARYIAAVYSGDSNNLSSASAVLSQAVKSLPAATTTKVTTSGSPLFINQPATFTATITSTYGPIPDGENVTFFDGATAIGTGATAHGVAKVDTSALTARAHTIKANYPGDATFMASSGTVTQVVNLYPSTTSRPASSLNPSIYGQSVTLTAKVVSSAGSSPTGIVTFKNGTMTLGSAAINASGVATLTKTNLPVGSLSITAAYSGDSVNAKSTSASLPQTVNQASSATTVKSSLNPSLLGQPVTFTATVKSPTSAPTGSITFLDGTNVLGTGTLSGGRTSYITSTLSTGSHSITAVYNGTANIGASTSAPLVQTVN
jgi:hypothetical protein